MVPFVSIRPVSDISAGEGFAEGAGVYVAVGWAAGVRAGVAAGVVVAFVDGVAEL
jgi:hypothetical protein